MAGQSLLKRKGVVISPKVYFVDAMNGMAQGLFASLLMGTILKTLATYIGMLNGKVFVDFALFLLSISTAASAVQGAAIGVGIAVALKSPVLVTACAAVVGHFANSHCGAGPLGVFVAVIAACELGKLVSKETKVDILVTPLTTLLTGFAVAHLTCPYIAVAMKWLGNFINEATNMHPFTMGIIISVVVGIILTLPISSAAICGSIGIAGIAGGAALAGCCAQMVGFAVSSYRENGVNGLVSQGIGTSMLQMPNIVRFPLIWLPPTLAAAITGPIATMVFKLECSGINAGMGTCGLTGPIGAINDMTASGKLDVVGWIGLLLVCIVLPAVLSLIFSEGLRKMGLIKQGQMTLEG